MLDNTNQFDVKQWVSEVLENYAKLTTNKSSNSNVSLMLYHKGIFLGYYDIKSYSDGINSASIEIYYQSANREFYVFLGSHMIKQATFVLRTFTDGLLREVDNIK